MPTNAELLEDILKLDPEAQVEGLNNAKLQALLTRLREDAEKKGSEPDSTDEETPPTDETDEAGAVVEVVFVVAQGKALTTLRGIIGEGEPIAESDLPSGKEAFDGFIKSKHIVRA